MSHVSKVVHIVSIALIVTLGITLWQRNALAVGQIYLSPSSSSVDINANTTISLRINPGTPVDGVEAVITYDAAKLQYVSIDPSGSAFDTSLGPQTGGGGNVSITRGSLSGTVNADALIVRVTFKALVGSGSTGLSVSGNATYSGSYTNPSGSSATVTLTTPAAPSTPPASTPSTPSTSTPKSGTTTPATPSTATPATPAVEEKAPVLTPALGEIQYSKAAIKLTSDVPVKAYLKYGLKAEQLTQQTAQTALSVNQELLFDQEKLVPGTTYYFSVVGQTATGKAVESAVQHFRTKGFTLNVTVLGKENKPLANQSVTLFSDPQIIKTNAQGVAEFSELEPGTHKLEYKKDNKTYSKLVLVENVLETGKSGKQSAIPQNAAVIFSEVGTANLPLTAIGFGLAGVLLVALIALVAWVFIQRNNRSGGTSSAKPTKVSSPNAPKQTIPVAAAVKPPASETTVLAEEAKE